MEKEVIEFRTKHGRSRKGCQGRIRNSWGVYSVYKHIRKNHWYNIGKPVSEHDFYSIIRMVNSLLAENLTNGIPVKFPGRMGQLELRKHKAGCSIVDGKLKITYPIDWAETWNLWFNDTEAHQQKTLKYDEQPEVFYTKYNKYNAAYNNKQFYQFTINREVKVALKENIKQGKVDTLWSRK